MLTNRRLPDQVDLTFGPPALIGRFILHADQTTRERGVYLSPGRPAGPPPHVQPKPGGA